MQAQNTNRYQYCNNAQSRLNTNKPETQLSHWSLEIKTVRDITAERYSPKPVHLLHIIIALLIQNLCGYRALVKKVNFHIFCVPLKMLYMEMLSGLSIF